jgi:hypothetical protein
LSSLSPNADQIIDDIKTFIKKAYPCKVELPEHPTVLSKKRNLELDFLEEYTSIVTVNDDVDRYFNNPPVIYIKNTKEDQSQWILIWYSNYAKEFPVIARVARDYLVIPGSEVDIEALFSLGRDIYSIRRWSLSTDTVRSLMLCKDALRR